MAKSSAPLPLVILIKFALNCALVWGMAEYLGSYFVLTGDLTAFVVVGALLTLMNIVVRPILALLTLPFKLFATILAIIIVQAAFVQLTVMIIERMEQNIVTLEIQGGLFGWVIVACVLGLGNWGIKAIMK